MLGARRHEHHRALPDLEILLAGQHLAPAADDHVHLLLGHMPVAGLLAPRLALHPGDTQMLRTELALGEQQVRPLAVAALVARTAGERLDVHDTIVDRPRPGLYGT